MKEMRIGTGLRGQTGVEYLLVIAGSIIFVAFVAYVVKNVLGSQ
jgi:hypothetical protein